MADIFISYKRGEDAAKVEALVGGLRANGYSVWWDRDIPAQAPWEDTIRAELTAAKLVIVCWSKEAIESENVRSEARYAKERNKLLQIFVTQCEAPLFFGEHQGLMILDVNDVYGPRFNALLSAVEERLGASASGAAQADGKEVRAWRREEPAASWEPMAFGFTLAAAGGLATLAGTTWFMNMGPDGPTAFALSRSSALAVLFALVGGWVSYALIARRPRRIGFFGGTLLSLACGAIAGALMLFADSVWRAAPFDVGPLLPAMDDPRALGFYALGAAICGFIGTRLFLPLFVAFLRGPLRNPALRFAVIALAFAPPIGAIATSTLGGAHSSVVVRRDEDIDLLIRQKGLATMADVDALVSDARYPHPMFAAETITRIRGELGLPAGGRNEELQDALIAREDKRDWVLAADGSGDATEMREILARSWGAITIAVRAGTYTPGDLVSDSPPPAATPTGEIPADLKGPLEMALWEDVNLDGEAWGDGARRGAEMRRSITIQPETPGAVVFEELNPLTMPSGFTLQGVTLRFTNPVSIELQTGASLLDVTIETPPANQSTLAFLSIVPAPAGAAESSGPFPPQQGPVISIIRNVSLSSAGGPLSGGIAVAPGASASIVGSRIGAIAAGMCIVVSSNEQVVIRDNDLRACANATGAIRIPASGAYNITNNQGARETPQTVLDPDGVNDFRVY